MGEIERGAGGADSQLIDALARVLDGDVSAVPVISKAEHVDVQDAAASLQRELVVTRAAALAVLTSLDDGSCSPEEVQAWASFVSCGYAPGARPPIRPVDIDYEEAWEDAIVEAVARLDEIGDVVDGTVTRSEIGLLLQLLGVP